MTALLLALLPVLGGFTQPLKDWFATKQEIAKKEIDYKLAVLTAQTQQAVAEAESDTQQNRDRLQATSQGFKQSVYVWFALILTFSIVCPSYAETMWHNLSLVPVWFQNLFIGMTLVIWGINPVKNGASWLQSTWTESAQARREYKLERAKINRETFYKSLREKLFVGKGIDQKTVDALEEALDQGEK